MNALSTFELFIFFGSLLAVMGVGLWAGRKEEDSADYFLAGRSARWWGVAGSIFGSNVSANHIVGMMGVGFSVGFAQSHFEISAIFGLLLLCYGFLPVYRKLNVYTLSEYLGRRYSDSSRMAYAVIMVIVIVVIQMVPGFYIGSRSLNILLQEEAGPIDPGHYKWGIVLMALVTGTYTIIGGLKAVIVTDVLQSILMLLGALVVGYLVFSQPEIGGWFGMRELDSVADAAREGKMHLYMPANHGDLPWTGVLSGLMILHFYYWGTNQFMVQRALAARSDREARLGIIVAGFFKLLIPFMSIGGGVAAYYMFRERGMEVAQDAAFTVLLKEIVAPVGLVIVGLVAAGLIGAILSSLDSMMNSGATIITFDFYKKYVNPEADEKKLILVGRIWIAVFLVVGAVLCVFTMDPNSEGSFFLHIASYQSKLVAGVVVAFALGMFWKRAPGAGAIVAILAGVLFSFGLPKVYELHCKSGDATVTSATALDMSKLAAYEAGEAIRFYVPDGFAAPGAAPSVDSKATYYVGSSGGDGVSLHATAADADAEVNPVLFDYEEGGKAKSVTLYSPMRESTVRQWGAGLNFMHTVFLAALFATVLHVVVSLMTQPDAEKSKLTWTELGGHDPGRTKKTGLLLVASLGIFAVLAVLMTKDVISPGLAGGVAAVITFGAFLRSALSAVARARSGEAGPDDCQPVLWKEDRLWGGLLCATAIFMMFYFV
jgi:SSS family solute:Na+ symporter